jgi:hypothetical protein
MPAYIGATVVHRCRVSVSRQRGVTACGIRFGLIDERFYGDGKYTEDYCDILLHRDGKLVCLCSHCRDRQPPWIR